MGDGEEPNYFDAALIVQLSGSRPGAEARSTVGVLLFSSAKLRLKLNQSVRTVPRLRDEVHVSSIVTASHPLSLSRCSSKPGAPTRVPTVAES